MRLPEKIQSVLNPVSTINRNLNQAESFKWIIKFQSLEFLSFGLLSTPFETRSVTRLSWLASCRHEYRQIFGEWMVLFSKSYSGTPVGEHFK